MTVPVSVIVSVFNSAQYLEKCIRSLRWQTLKSFEVILFDAGSKDQSPSLCQDAARADSRFRYIRSELPLPISEARNSALRHCKGDYVAVLDSDDIAFPKRLALQHAFLSTHPQTVLLGSYFRVINAWGFPIRLSAIHYSEDIELRWRITFGNCIAHSTVMFPRHVANRIGGYNPDIKAGEDMDFYSRMIEHGQAYLLPTVLTAWRVHSNSLSKTEAVELKNDFIVSVQRSLQKHAGLEVRPEVAAALYNQSNAPAKDAAQFRECLKVISTASASFRLRPGLDARGQWLLGRAIFIQLLDLLHRNFKNAWWGDVADNWRDCTRKLALGPAYNFRKDAGLILYYKKLVRVLLDVLPAIGKRWSQ